MYAWIFETAQQISMRIFLLDRGIEEEGLCHREQKEKIKKKCFPSKILAHYVKKSLYTLKNCSTA